MIIPGGMRRDKSGVAYATTSGNTNNPRKRKATRWINDDRKVRRRLEWQRGYGAFSVSESKSEAVKRYIDNQKKHHERKTYEQEFIDLLTKHRIPFDRQHIFDRVIAG